MSGNAHRWTFVLAFAAACNVLCYGVFFARPFDLLLLYSRPLTNLYRLSQENPGARGWLIAGYMALGALYWVGWQAARRARGRMAWAAVLSGALLSGVVLLRVMPLGAADIFDNIMHGRIIAVYGATHLWMWCDSIGVTRSTGTQHGAMCLRPTVRPGSCWRLGPRGWQETASWPT